MELSNMNSSANKDLFKPKYLKINTKDIFIPEHAQRKFKQHHGDYLAANFTVEKYKPIDVSFRDGKYWVIDGQHRLYAIKKRKGGNCTILCYVHYGMTEYDEAMFFLDQGKGIANILTTDRARIRFEIGDETVVGMVRGAESAGFSVDFSTNKATNRIVAVSALEQVYKALNPQEYVTMLKTLKKAYNGRPDSLVREMLYGLGLLFVKYHGEFDPNALATSLRTKATPSDIIIEGRSYGKAHSGHNGLASNGKPFARAILHYYNANRKASNQLPDIL